MAQKRTAETKKRKRAKEVRKVLEVTGLPLYVTHIQPQDGVAFVHQVRATLTMDSAGSGMLYINTGIQPCVVEVPVRTVSRMVDGVPQDVPLNKLSLPDIVGSLESAIVFNDGYATTPSSALVAYIRRTRDSIFGRPDSVYGEMLETLYTATLPLLFKVMLVEKEILGAPPRPSVTMTPSSRKGSQCKPRNGCGGKK